VFTHESRAAAHASMAARPKAITLSADHADGQPKDKPELRNRMSLRREQDRDLHSLMHMLATLRRNSPTRAVNLGAGT